MNIRGNLGLLTGVSALALASITAAQAQTAAPVEQVVVTGSRLVTNGNDMPTPVTVVAPDDLTAVVPATVFDGLALLPEFSAVGGPTGNPGTSANNNNAHSLNLRSLGATRTLVLFDGRRLAATNQAGGIDADEIPQMLLKRIDVVTGGASSVYGSDAVTGVVNFVVDNKYNGIKTKAQYGKSVWGDGTQYQVGVAGGMNILGGKGHVEGSYEFYNNDGVRGFQKNKRPWAQHVWITGGSGVATNPVRLIDNGRISSTSFLGYITTANPAANPLRDMVFGINGVLRPFVHGAQTGTNGNESGGDGAYYDDATLEAPTARNSVFGRADYDFSNDLSAFVEVNYMKVHQDDIHQNNEMRAFTYSATNAFLAPQYQTAMLNAKQTTFIFSKMSHQMKTLDANAWVTDAMITGGLTGNFMGYRWEVNANHSANRQTVFGDYNLDNGKLAAALDAVTASTGQVVCNVTITNPGLYPGCVPLNEFGPTSEDQAAINYVTTKTFYTALNTMDDLGGNIAGSPFSDWAGPVEVAVGAEYRYTSLKIISNVDPTARLNCTGLRFNCLAPPSATPTTISFVVGAAPRVTQDVKEASLETGVPLLRSLPFAQAVDLNAAVRYTDYSTSGTVTTWKVGGTWAVNDEINLRLTRSLDIRAPTLAELFAPLLVAPNGTSDLHTNFAGIIPLDTISNPNLVPEQANTWTVGGVYRPSWLPDFSVSVDYYKIKIGNGIGSITGSTKEISDICEASLGADKFCALAIRPFPWADHSVANTATAFIRESLNVASVRTEGTDFEVNYQTDIGPGHFSFRGLATYQPLLKSKSFANSIVTTNAAGANGLASLRGTLFFKYTWDDFSLDVSDRLHNGTRWNSDPSVFYQTTSLPAVSYTNATITYNWDPASLYFTVENLFNRQPTPYNGAGAQQGIPGLFNGFAGGDDVIGRFYTIGIRLKFN